MTQRREDALCAFVSLWWTFAAMTEGSDLPPLDISCIGAGDVWRVSEVRVRWTPETG